MDIYLYCMTIDVFDCCLAALEYNLMHSDANVILDTKMNKSAIVNDEEQIRGTKKRSILGPTTDDSHERHTQI
jgi:hypothetical protein